MGQYSDRYVKALRDKVEGQRLLLIAYRLTSRPPERAFKLIERADKVLAKEAASAPQGAATGEGVSDG